MRSPRGKNFDVYDFQEGDDGDEMDKAEQQQLKRFGEKLRGNYRPEVSTPVGKLKFLEVFSQDGNVGTMDVADVICLDSDERNPEREVGFHTSAVDPAHGMHISSEEEEESPVSLRSPDDNLQTDGCEEDTGIECINHSLADELHVLSPSHISQRDCSLIENPSNLEQLCPNSDNDEEERTVSSSCHSPNDSGCSFDHPDIIDSQNSYERQEDADMTVIISPDYIVCGDRLYSESQLIFSPECIKIGCLDAHGSDTAFISEWATENLINIDCLWSQSVENAWVEIRLKIINEIGSSEMHRHHNLPGFVSLTFTVCGPHWSWKEQKIKSLAPKYKDVWKVGSIVRKALYPDDSVRANPFFTSHYLTDFMETFEDVVFPEGDPDAVSVSRRDMELLQPETFINDTVIDFYIKYLKNKMIPEERSRLHFFNSFFFRKLADMDKDPQSRLEGRAAFLRVRKWTRKVNIFRKDYVFIPVNFNLHWSLLVICHPGEIVEFEEENMDQSFKVPCILHMDSLRGSHTGLKSLMQSYLWEEWKERNTDSSADTASRFSNMRFISLELPQQENMFDCGVFLLHFVELFLKEAPVNFNPFDITTHSNFLNHDWFVPAEASLKRFLIRNLLYDLLRRASQDGSLNNDLSEIRNHGLEREHSSELVSNNCLAINTGLVDTAISAVDRGIQLELWASSSDVPCPKEGEITAQQLLLPETTSGCCIDRDGFDFHGTASLKNHRYVLSPILEEGAEQSSFPDSEKDVPRTIPMDIDMSEISDNLNHAMQFKETEDGDSVLDTPTDGSGNSSKLCSSQIDADVFNNPPVSHTSILKEADNPDSSDVSSCREILDKCIVEDSQETDTSVSLSRNVNDLPSALGEKHEGDSQTPHSDDLLETCIVEDSQEVDAANEEMEQIQQPTSADKKYNDNVQENPEICMVDEDKDSQKDDVDEDPLHFSRQNDNDDDHNQSLISSSKDGIGICNVVSLDADEDDDLQIRSDGTYNSDGGLSEYNKPCKRQKLEHTEIQRIRTRSSRTSGIN